MVGDIRGIISVAIVLVFLFKINSEEGLLASEFGEQHAAYKSKNKRANTGCLLSVA